METTSFVHYRSFRSPTAAIWQCLTLPQRLAGWLGEVEMDLTREGALSVKTWNGDVRRGKILAAVPTAKLEFVWRPLDFDPESRVVWKLRGDGPGSRLTVTHDGLRSREERDLTRARERRASGSAASQRGNEASLGVRRRLLERAAAAELVHELRHGVERAEPEVLPDLLVGRRIASAVEEIGDEFVSGMLPRREREHRNSVGEQKVKVKRVPKALPIHDPLSLR